MKSRISVIIPVYNFGGYLPRTIQSALDQTFVDFELIIVDDASTEDIPTIITRFPDPRIRYVRNGTNLGVDASVNKGFEIAHGTYVCSLDADDWLPKDSLALRYDAIKERDFEVIHAGVTRHDDISGKEQYVPPLSVGSGELCAFLSQKNRKVGINTQTFLYHKRVFERMGYRHEANPYIDSNDYEFSLRILTSSAKIAVLDKNVYYYRIHPGSMSHQSVYKEMADQKRRTLEQRYYDTFCT